MIPYVYAEMPELLSSVKQHRRAIRRANNKRWLVRTEKQGWSALAARKRRDNRKLCSCFLCSSGLSYKEPLPSIREGLEDYDAWDNGEAEWCEYCAARAWREMYDMAYSEDSNWDKYRDTAITNPYWWEV